MSEKLPATQQHVNEERATLLTGRHPWAIVALVVLALVIGMILLGMFVHPAEAADPIPVTVTPTSTPVLVTPVPVTPTPATTEYPTPVQIPNLSATSIAPITGTVHSPMTITVWVGNSSPVTITQISVWDSIPWMSDLDESSIQVVLPAGATGSVETKEYGFGLYINQLAPFEYASVTFSVTPYRTGYNYNGMSYTYAGDTFTWGQYLSTKTWVDGPLDVTCGNALQVRIPVPEIFTTGSWGVLTDPDGKRWLLSHVSNSTQQEFYLEPDSEWTHDIRTNERLPLLDGDYSLTIVEGPYWNYPSDNDLASMPVLWEKDWTLNCRPDPDVYTSIVELPAAPMYVGERTTFAVEVGNKGGEAATDITATFSVPAGTEVVAVEFEIGQGQQMQMVQPETKLPIMINKIEPGQYVRIRVTIIPRTFGIFPITGEVSSASPDSNPGNNIWGFLGHTTGRFSLFLPLMSR